MKLSTLLEVIQKPQSIQGRLRERMFNARKHLLKSIYGTRFRFWIYPVYWRYLWQSVIGQTNNQANSATDFENKHKRYITIIPNPRAGIGHQLANWNTAFIFSQKLNLKFVHHPFSNAFSTKFSSSNKKWEDFFGFGEGEAQYSDIFKDKSIKNIRLPLVYQKNDQEGEILIDKIVNFIYPNNNILFHLELDQNIYDQTPTAHILREKYWQRRKKQPINNNFDSNKLNIAVHVRRGDVLKLKEQNSSNWQERWLEPSYYIAILKTLSELVNIKPIDIHIYSQGNIEDFQGFSELSSVIFHLNEDDIQTFHGMVVADILITSPSSFSYKAGMISQGVKVAKYPWWHHVPQNEEWIRSDAEGNFDLNTIRQKFSKSSSLNF